MAIVVVQNVPPFSSYPVADTRTILYATNAKLYGGSSLLPGLGNIYYSTTSTVVKIVATIVDGQGNRQSQIDQVLLGYPPVLMAPLIKNVVDSAGNKVVADQIYFVTSIQQGIITMLGKFPTSGDWKLDQDRLNAALAAVKAHWKLELAGLSFLVATPTS